MSESELDCSSDSEWHENSAASGSSCSKLCSSSDFAVTSLLSCLRLPKAADPARKRRIEVNPPMGKKRGKGCENNDP